IQNELFDLGSDLATLPADRHPKQPVIEKRHVERLEAIVDEWNEGLPELTSFVLPGGGATAAHLHLARTVCRRAERVVAALSRTEPIGPESLVYLNRLSDLLFVLGRWSARARGEAEPLWRPDAR
ncbi:MAG TPA: cob(I)yrinic acid a,c-diamide adenosyltransferase, partial [Thermoanaerobaculia bacterium]|nr:cob(I)yrinic acid a,c-diamide adenosyltransferase [Thermoanaerobaculia bacterium]